MNRIAFPGEELREKREALGLSQTDIYRKIRIPVRYVDALERGELDSLPSGCYCMGFLKTYCSLLETDAERYMDLFRACSTPAQPRFLGKGHIGGGALPAWTSDALTWVTICAILALGWLTYSVVLRPGADLTDGRVQAGTQDATEMVVPPAPADIEGSLDLEAEN